MRMRSNKVAQLPTLFSKGVQIARCDRCGEELIELLGENVPETATFEVAPGKTTGGTVHFRIVAD